MRKVEQAPHPFDRRRYAFRSILLVSATASLPGIPSTMANKPPVPDILWERFVFQVGIFLLFGLLIITAVAIGLWPVLFALCLIVAYFILAAFVIVSLKYLKSGLAAVVILTGFCLFGVVVAKIIRDADAEADRNIPTLEPPKKIGRR